MEEFSCLRWVKDLFCQSNTNPHLPNDIVLNILSRLPAECVLRCLETRTPLRVLMSTSAFLNMHFHNSLPLIAFSSLHNSNNSFSKKRVVSFTGDIMTKRITTKDTPSEFGSWTKPALFCSLNGFLVFKEVRQVFIWNPVTKQTGFVKLPEGSNFYGLFCHPTTDEYQVLYSQGKPGSLIRAHGCMSETNRNVGTFSHPPSTVKPPVNLNGVLHWMVSDVDHKAERNVWPDCSNSIILFDISTETSSTIQHPGNQCTLRKYHDKMELVEVKGCLSLCDVSSDTHIEIWVMEDYENRFWEKKHVIPIDPLLSCCGIQPKYGNHEYVGGFHMYNNNELLLRVARNHLLLYNLRLGTIRRVGNDIKNNMDVIAVPHVNSLILDIHSYM